MKLDRFIRIAIAFVVVAAFVVTVGGLLFVTESALDLGDRLREGPAVLLYLYAFVMALLVFAVCWLIYKLVVRRRPAPATAEKTLSKDDIEERLRTADRTGIDTSEAQAELKELAATQADGVIRLCFFGQISTGKSSLIKALVPEANVVIDVVGGSTDDVRRYRWQSDAGQEIYLTDVPGTGGHENGLDKVAADEARRAHLVLFVCDSDLTRAETNAVRQLLEFEKPVIIVLNKSDRYDQDELATLMGRLLEHIDELGGAVNRDQVVAVTAGGEAEVVHRDADGAEVTSKRSRPADIGVLVVAINRMLDEEAGIAGCTPGTGHLPHRHGETGCGRSRVSKAARRTDHTQFNPQGSSRCACSSESRN